MAELNLKKIADKSGKKIGARMIETGMKLSKGVAKGISTTTKTVSSKLRTEMEARKRLKDEETAIAKRYENRYRKQIIHDKYRTKYERMREEAKKPKRMLIEPLV